MLNNLRTSKTNEVLSKVYLKAVKEIFIRALKFAKHQNYIYSYLEIIEDVKMPFNLKVSNADKNFLDYKDMAKVLYTVRNNLEYYTIITVLTLTGIRAQELFALRKQDIDRENHRIHIVQAIKYSEKKKPTDRAYQIGSLKTESSYRYVPAVDSVLNLIDMWLEYRVKQGIQNLADTQGNTELVFTTKQGHVIQRDVAFVSMRNYIKEHASKEVPRFSYYVRRHCFATYLDREDCPIRIIQQCMGHSTRQGSVTEIHYISPEPNYIKKALVYVKQVENKLIQAYKQVQNEYLNDNI